VSGDLGAGVGREAVERGPGDTDDGLELDDHGAGGGIRAGAAMTPRQAAQKMSSWARRRWAVAEAR